ncbi:MAG: hypothetical protein GWN58_22650 [Anaerolineae bacterium]|nr:hypothetical protein [Anaerolineae bacterium]
MKRIATLTSFLIQDLSRSLTGIVPLASTLAFGLIAFEYGMDQPQFTTVAGVGMGAICLATGLVLASRANRATSFLFVARLHRRTELLAALVVGSLVVTTVLSLGMALANLLAGRLTLDFPSALWIPLAWLPLWLLAAALALPLSSLVGRRGSHLVGYLLLAGLLIANDRKAFLTRHGMDWVSRIVDAILWPVSTLLARASAEIHNPDFYLAWALACAYAVLLFGLAASLFNDKDLLWSE